MKQQSSDPPRRTFLKYVTVASTAGLLGHATASASPAIKKSTMLYPQSTRGFFKEKFSEAADEIYRRHWQQTHATVAALKQRYAKPVLGNISPMRCFERLTLCVDPTDTTLFTANQLVHTLQVLEGMEQDGITDRDMLIAGAVHDLGKILLLNGEVAENVVCGNRPIGDNETNVGLDNVVFQWNHDEFIYDRLKGYLPDHVSWLIRYHSIDIDRSIPYMDMRDEQYLAQYLRPFRKYDQGTKSQTYLPEKNIYDYAGLISDYLPTKILI